MTDPLVTNILKGQPSEPAAQRVHHKSMFGGCNAKGYSTYLTMLTKEEEEDCLAMLWTICSLQFVPWGDTEYVDHEYESEGDQQPLIAVDEANNTHYLLDDGHVVVLNYNKLDEHGDPVSAVYQLSRFVANTGWVDRKPVVIKEDE